MFSPAEEEEDPSRPPQENVQGSIHVIVLLLKTMYTEPHWGFKKDERER